MNKRVISKDGIEYAIIISSYFGEAGINFVTKEDNPLQFCILMHEEGHKIPPHIHKVRERVVTEVQEVLYIEFGLVVVHLFDKEGNHIEDVPLERYDTIVLLRGGHGFTFKEDSSIIYTKQGPYYGKEEDKEIIGNPER